MDGTLVFGNVDYTTATQYIEVHEGNYKVDLFKAGTSDKLLNFGISLTGGNVYSIFGEGSEGKILAKVTDDYFPPPTSYLRIINVSPNIGHVDFTLNGSPLFPNLNFKKSSSYQQIHPGSYRVLVLPHNEKNPVYLEDNISLLNSNSYSYLLTGEWNSTQRRDHLQSLLVEDDNQLPDAKDIKMRFIHTCVNCPPLQIRANGVILFHNIGFRQVGKYQLMEAAGYTIHVYDNQQGNKVQSFDLDLRTHKDKSAVYTLIATGHDLDSLSLMSIHDAGSHPPKPHRKKSRSRSGLIAMTVIFSVLAALLLAVGVWILVRRRRTGYSRLS
jgi:hypothetical protein